MPKFPKLIHVMEACEDDCRYLEVHTDGVASFEDDGTEIAIYQLVKVGTLSVQKQFIDKKKRSVR